MKKLIPPIFVVLVSIIFSLPVSAKEPHEVKLDCPKISSILNFTGNGQGSGYMVCFTDNDKVKVSTTLVSLSGGIDIGLPGERVLSDPSEPSAGKIPDKIEDLPIGDGGKIFYNGYPWGQSYSIPIVEYSARVGLCNIRLEGSALADYPGEGFSGKKPDWQAASKYIVEKLSVAIKEVESSIADECGAKNITGSKNNSQQTEPRQPQSEDKENLFIKALGGFPVFTGEWFKAISTGMNLREFFAGLRVGADEFFTDDEILIWEAQKKQEELKRLGKVLNDEELWQFGVDPKEILERNSKLIEEAEVEKLIRQARQLDSPYSIDILNGQAQIKLPGQNEWKDLKQGDKIPPGSTIFTGMDTTTVLTIAGKGVVQVEPFTEITINEKGLAEAAETGQTYTDIELKTGEIEVNIENGVFTAPILQIHTPSVIAGVNGTHFWVSYNRDKNLSTVGVYKGKVEVKARGSGKSILVSPNGDKPGIVVIAQKLSLPKLALGGLVLVAIIGGTVLFLKRRDVKTSVSKKKTAK